jgi:hypothetical protein
VVHVIDAVGGVRSQLPTPEGGGSGGGGGSTVVDPDGLVELARSVLQDLHADARAVRRRLRELTQTEDDLGPDPKAKELGAVVTTTLDVYLAWSREIESLLQDFQEAMVAAAKEYRDADDVTAEEVRRRSTEVFTDRAGVPVDADGDGRIDRVDRSGERAGEQGGR